MGRDSDLEGGWQGGAQVCLAVTSFRAGVSAASAADSASANGRLGLVYFSTGAAPFGRCRRYSPPPPPSSLPSPSPFRLQRLLEGAGKRLIRPRRSPTATLHRSSDQLSGESGPRPRLVPARSPCPRSHRQSSAIHLLRQQERSGSLHRAQHLQVPTRRPIPGLHHRSVDFLHQLRRRSRSLSPLLPPEEDDQPSDQPATSRNHPPGGPVCCPAGIELPVSLVETSCSAATGELRPDSVEAELEARAGQADHCAGALRHIRRLGCPSLGA